MYYSHKLEFVKASNIVYLERQLLEYFLSTYHHGWISEESQAEAYNETWRDSKQVQLVKIFLDENPLVGVNFKKKNGPANSDDDLCDRFDDDDGESETFDRDESIRKSSFCGMFEVSRKSLAQGYYELWIFEELTERGLLDKYLFGPFYLGMHLRFISWSYFHQFFLDKDKKILLTFKASVELFLAKVDSLRTNELYPHPVCSGKRLDIFNKVEILNLKS